MKYSLNLNARHGVLKNIDTFLISNLDLIWS